MEDSDKKICGNYFETGYFKCTSSTVKMESKNTINKIKNINVVILEFIKNYISTNNVPDNRIGSSLKTIKADFLEINGKFFNGSQDLKRDIKGIINVLDKLCLWENLIISLKYVNEITLESVEDWGEWVNPQLHNFNFMPDKSQLVRSLTRAEYKISDFHLVFQYGQYNIDYPSTFIRNDFILDYECIRPDGCDIYLIKHDLRRMKKIIFNA